MMTHSEEQLIFEQLILKRIEELEKHQKEQDEKIECLEDEIHFINNHLKR